MNDSTKTLIGSVAALLALVASIAIMSDCSKHIANVEADPQKACLQASGQWLQESPGAIGHCEKSRSGGRAA